MTTQQAQQIAPGDDDLDEVRAAHETEQVRRIVGDVRSPTEEHAARLLRAFEVWRDLVAQKTAEGKKLGEKIKGKLALFNEAMHIGHSSESDQLVKLVIVEGRYQEWQEAVAEKKTVCGALGEQVKAARTTVDELIEEAHTRQMSLFSPRPSDDEGGGAGDMSSPD